MAHHQQRQSGGGGASFGCATYPPIEVGGLEGRAAVANGLYIDTGQSVNGRPKYEQTTWLSAVPGDLGSNWQHRVEGPCHLLYDEADGLKEWIVEVPNDPGRAFAYVEDDAATPDAVRRDWLVWYCDEHTRIEDGVWLELGKVGSPPPFRVVRAVAESSDATADTPDDERESDWDGDLFHSAVAGPDPDDEGPQPAPAPAPADVSPLSRQRTRRTQGAEESLDALSTKLAGLEERVQYLDADTTNPETLGRLTGRLNEVSSALDGMLVRGLTGETPLTDQRKALRDRVDAQLAIVERKAAAQATAPEPEPAQPEPAPHTDTLEDHGSPYLTRTETRRTHEADDSLDTLSMEIAGLEERVQYLDRASSKEILDRLMRQLGQLSSKLDDILVRGLTGETPLKDRRKALRDRVDAQLAILERQAAAQAAQAMEPDRAQTESASRRALTRSQSRHAVASNESLDALSTKLQGLEGRVQDLEAHARQETLTRLQFELDQLEDELSRTTVRGSVR
eukprot:COSAG02_NODE_1671_length_11389_cov_24.192826_5_plen_509_part_00